MKLLAAALALLAAAPALAQAPARTLESFDSAAEWTANASDSVTSSVASVPGETGQALRLSYDFGRVSGYAFARKPLAVTFPENFELSFQIRGAPEHVNDLQIKFVDASGDNVWWVQKLNFKPSANGWQTVRIPRREVTFAWGPAEDKTLRETAFLEIVVVRGRDGGKGYVEIDNLTLTPLPADPPAPAAPKPSDPALIDGDPTTAARVSDRRPATLDFGAPREVGGLVLHWKGTPPPRFSVEVQDGADARWRPLVADYRSGGTDPLWLGDRQEPHVRLRVTVPPGVRAELAEIELKPREWGESPTAMVSALAKDAPRGTFPRGFTEQSYWTLVGTDGGSESALIGEDGAIEFGKGLFSIEPFVTVDGKQTGWADARTGHALLDGYLPVPKVGWEQGDWGLEVELLVDTDTGLAMARYRVSNKGTARRDFQLVLALRPYQVNPAAQFLSQQGGVARTDAIAAGPNSIEVTFPNRTAEGSETRTIRLPVQPTEIRRARFDSTDFTHGDRIEGRTIEQPRGLASAAMTYTLPLAPGETREVVIAVPLTNQAAVAETPDYETARNRTAAWWRERLGSVKIRVPQAHQDVPNSVRAATAQILMSRAGPMLKPGTRSYNRSWIRDGAMISDGLLRLGIVDPVVDYADWYADYLFDNGKVPCCVDYRGADPVPENDSHGEFIHLIVQLYRFTGDTARLERQWPKLAAALTYMETLRQSERTDANRAPGRRMLYGLMPPSISHEGYSAKPQYSLWDDFWALTGYKDAADAARILNKPQAAQIARQRDEFQTDLHAAIRAAADHWKIDFIPGATSLGDLDATSTTMGLDPAGEQARLDPVLLANTFERYWAKFVGRRDGTIAWEDYTPYELRNVSAFVRLGWRERAQQLLTFFFDDQRPHAWNGWAEVVGRDPREIRFIGDMPHAWVASDYIRAALDLFAYERHDDGVLVLGAGLTRSYLDGEGSSVAGLRTRWGTLDLTMRVEGDTLVVRIGGDALPPGGYLLPWPFEGAPGAATVDGKDAVFRAEGLRIAATGRPVVVRVGGVR